MQLEGGAAWSNGLFTKKYNLIRLTIHVSKGGGLGSSAEDKKTSGFEDGKRNILNQTFVKSWKEKSKAGGELRHILSFGKRKRATLTGQD